MELSVAIAGPLSYGTFALRGRPLAKDIGAEILDISRPPTRDYDVVVLIKRMLSPGFSPSPEFRKRAGKLIFDPLDYWSSKEKMRAGKFWRLTLNQINPDVTLATSPSCLRSMTHPGIDRRIELVPHQSDPRVRPNWYNPLGPVVYVGDPRFIYPRKSVIREACDMMGLKLVLSKNVDDLKGASLALALRFGPWDSDLNRKCKPQIKVENAIAGGIPVLVTGHLAEIERHSSLAEVLDKGTACPKKYVSYMTEAIARGVHLETHYSEENYLAKMRELIYED